MINPLNLVRKLPEEFKEESEDSYVFHFNEVIGSIFSFLWVVKLLGSSGNDPWRYGF